MGGCRCWVLHVWLQTNLLAAAIFQWTNKFSMWKIKSRPTFSLISEAVSIRYSHDMEKNTIVTSFHGDFKHNLCVIKNGTCWIRKREFSVNKSASSNESTSTLLVPDFCARNPNERFQKVAQYDSYFTVRAIRTLWNLAIIDRCKLN